MYVCNCNGLRSSAVEDAILSGARCPADVYAHHGCAMQCGKCCDEIKACIIRSRYTETRTQAA